MTTRLLIATVGGSPEPLAASLLHWRPARTFFVVSKETKTTVAKDVLPAVQNEGWTDFDAGRYDLVEVPSAQDFTAIVTALHSLDAKVANWQRQHPATELIADFTGGTKAMTAGLALTAARWPCQISYVGGTERTKDGVGIVVSGKEQIVHAQNPWDALGYLAAEQAILLFNHGDYSAAAQLLESTRNRMADGVKKREFQAFTALCQSFECWERFQHKEAHAKFTKVLDSKNDLASLLGQHRADAVLIWLAKASDTLIPLTTAQTETTSLTALVADLLANASRRIKEGRYDDAVARLYRAIEALAQAKLHTHGFPDTSNIPMTKLPESLRAKWSDRADEGFLKIGLQDDYLLLNELKDEAGIQFAALELNDPQRSLLVARNSSILAHGYTPVGKEVAERLFDSALKLSGLEKLKLTPFPTL